MTESEQLQRLKEISDEMDLLKSRIAELEEEQIILIQLMKYNSIIKLLPARPRNALIRIGIDTDSKLVCFLNGNPSAVSPFFTGFRKETYEKAKTKKERLLSILNIGEGSANEVLAILESHGF